MINHSLDSQQSKIESIQIGKPKDLVANEKIYSSGIFKHPVQEPVHVSKEGIEGDYIGGQGVHGGPLRALYIYPQDGYSHWIDLLPKALMSPGMFGENVVVTRLEEKEIFIGDIFRLGKTLIQATVPRIPCILLQRKLGRDDVIEKFYEFERPGVYFKVLEAGIIQIHDQLILTEKLNSHISQFDLFKLYQAKTIANEDYQYLMTHPLVNDVWKTRMQQWKIKP